MNKFLAICAGVLLTGVVAQAATISWGTVTDYAAASDVSTQGILVEAVNLCGSGDFVSPTVNGVQFAADTSLLSGDAATTFFYGDVDDYAYRQLLNTLDYGSSDAAVSVGDGQLEVGKEYLVQAWFVDERGSTDARTMKFGDGHGNFSAEVNDQYVIGTFTADGSSQTLVIDGVSSGPHFNAYQVRDLSSALPTLSTSAGDTVSSGYSVVVGFSESVSGLTAGDFTVVNGTASGVSGSGTSWSVTITPAANGDVTVTLPKDAVVDVDGHGNIASESLVVTYVAPGSDQPVPSLSTVSNKVYGDYSVQVEFSEPVIGLTASDFAITNATVSSVSGSGTSYTVVVNPNFGGDVVLCLPRNSVTDTDGDGLQNAASDELVTAYHVVVSVNDPEELLPYLLQDNVHATMAPGTYTIDEEDVRNTFGTPRLAFRGSNSTYDFTDVTINFAEDIYLADLGLDNLQVFGNNNVLLNLTMVNLCDKYGEEGLEGGNMIVVDGRNNRIEGFHTTTRGSYPYGYGEAFGKGGPYTVGGIKKSCSLLLRGEYNHVKDCTLIHRAFGHALYMQACDYPTVEGCYIEGEMRSTDDMLAEEGTGTVGDSVDFMTYWGYPIPSGYMMCLGEEGIRAYSGGNTYIDGEWSDNKGTSNPTIINNTIVNMRAGVTLTHATGTKYVSGCTAIGCERGFAIGSGIIENCAADAKHGPVFGVDYQGDSGIVADITILPYEGSHTNGSGHLAYILGSDHKITFRGLEENPDQTLTIDMGGDKRINGNLAEVDNFAADDIVLNNLTGYPVVFDDNSSGNSGQSIGSITDAGTGNSFTMLDWDTVTANLALHGTVTQSSTAYDAIASLATDQNTTGTWTGKSVTHTESEAQAWWKIDLAENCSISEIRIWNRTDAGVARLSDYDVTILDDAGQPVWTTYQADYPDPMVSLDTAYTVGQSVLIQQRGTSPMNIAEVEINGISLDQDSEPIGHWMLDEDYGSIAADSSGNGFDGTVEHAVWVSGHLGGALEFNGSSSVVHIPGAAFSTVSNEISIAFWAYGDDSLPVENSAFYAVNSTGGRVLNIHLPFSNGAVYWDAGADTGYDRISKAASADEYKGSWAHWVFTKNADTGTMRIFRNGALWHSGTAKTRSMLGIVSAMIGSNTSGNYYAGTIDDVRLYDVALSADDVTALYAAEAVSKAGEFMSHSDLGTPSYAGSVSYSNGVYTVIGGGSDIQGTSDSGYFVSDSHSGDGEIATQVTSVENTHAWAKAGPMFRESSAAGSKNVFLAVRPDNQISMQYRDATGGSTGYWNPVGGTDVKWVKLVRLGDLFTGYYSADGVSWTEIASVSVSMKNEIERGLAVTSHDDASLCIATFNMVPPAPEGLAAESIDEDEIDLLWSSSVSATSYNLKRATVSGGAYASVNGSLSSTNCSDTGLSAGTVYFYVVCGEYCGVEGDASAEVSAVPSAVIIPDDVVIGSAAVSLDGSDFTLSLSNSVLGHSYRVLAADDLADPDWQVVSMTNSGNGGLLTIEIPMGSADTNRFYKLETWRQ